MNFLVCIPNVGLKLGRVGVILGYFLGLLMVELEFGPNIVVYCLIFSNTPILLNLELYNSSYAFVCEGMSVWSFH